MDKNERNKFNRIANPNIPDEFITEKKIATAGTLKLKQTI